MTIKRARVTRAELDAFPEGAVWNAFVQLLSLSDPSELSSEQLAAHHAFWYDAEVQNGGHLQYFINRGIDEAQRATGDLRRLGADDFGDLLERAIALWNSQERKRPNSASQFVGLARDREFESFDLEYYSLSPTLIELLGKHLEAFQDQYVLLE